MPLMISVSGIRGLVGSDLTPELVARYAAALGAWSAARGNASVVLGRDARTSGPMFAQAATAGLLSVGCHVIDVGMVTTPTGQLAVEHHHAGAGLILTASHNPVEWNALKLVGPDGIFLDAAAGAAVRALAESPEGPARSGWDALGSVEQDDGALARHLDLVLELPELDVRLIRSRRFRVALDCVRGVGGRIIPELLERLGCEVHGIHLESDGRFPREPEPVPENLGELGRLVTRSGAQVGMAVDPDVDRLALVDERGEPIGEDYTLAFAVRAVLPGTGNPVGGDGNPDRASRLPAPGSRPAVVANLSTSLVVEDAVRDAGGRLVRAPVGESNVARAIQTEAAVIGGEGNGGVILPSLHIGRDAPLGVALILQYLARENQSVSALVAAHPRYRIVKAKFKRGNDLAKVAGALKASFPEASVDEQDGLRLAWPDKWVHLRNSGTEPITRVIAEARTATEAEELVGLCRSYL